MFSQLNNFDSTTTIKILVSLNDQCIYCISHSLDLKEFNNNGKEYWRGIAKKFVGQFVLSHPYCFKTTNISNTEFLVLKNCLKRLFGDNPTQYHEI